MKTYNRLLFLSLVFFTLCGLGVHAASANTDFTQVAKKSIPAVVSVKVDLDYPQQEMEDPFEMFKQDDFWGRFFQQQPRSQQPRKRQGQGSGFIVTKDGYILTNNHIVNGASRILVTLANGKEYAAKVIGQDPSTDIAVIKIDTDNLPYLPLGNSDNLQVGEWVTAIGNPMGLQATLTVGVVSATGRSNLGLTQFENFIQTDAAINFGNSGGPLLNMNGEVIGINTAIAAHNAGYTGIGFAIPSTMANQVMEQLINEGSVTRSYVGILLQEVDNDIAEAFNLEKIHGALVADVIAGSPADKANLKPGDVILQLNGDEVKSVGAFRNMIAIMKPGSPVQLLIKRDGKTFTTRIELAPHPENGVAVNGNTSKIGIFVEPLTAEMAKSIGKEHGVVVSRVEQRSVAAWAGVKKGAVILSVNGEKVGTPEEFYQKINQTPKGKATVIHITQDGTTRFLSLKDN